MPCSIYLLGSCGPTSSLQFKAGIHFKTSFCSGIMKILCLLFMAFIAHCYAATQKYSVKGRLLCGESPLGGIQVKLVDKDVGIDDTLGNVNSNAQGYFEVEGQANSELMGIDPVLKIYHRCGGGIHPCPRRWRLKLPKSYIISGNQPSKPYNLGELNLIVRLDHDEDRNCI